jgi:hypothetical protein
MPTKVAVLAACLTLWLAPALAHAQLREMRQTIFGMD